MRLGCRIDGDADVIMFDKGPHVSFSNCALPYHLSGIVENSQDLVLMSPEKFKKHYTIEARVNSEVVRIDRDSKKVTVRDLTNGEEYEEAYDKLVLSPGASPILPRNIDGIDRQHVFTVRNVVDIERISKYIQKWDIQDVAVVGGGFIGVEVAENLRLAGRNVSLIEAQDQIMTPFDYDMAQMLHKELMDNGINLILSDGILQMEEDAIELLSGRKRAA